MTLKNFVRAIRVRTGLNQIEFGRKIGVNSDKDRVLQAAVSRYERGKEITIDVLERMLGTIGMRLSQCLSLPEDRKQNLEAHKILDHLIDSERSGEVLRFLDHQLEAVKSGRMEGPEPGRKTGTRNR